MAQTSRQDEHVGELLSGYIDDELTQQVRQRVERHCEQCTECSTQLERFQSLKVEIGDASLSRRANDIWRENMESNGIGTTRNIGWILLIGGIVLATSIAFVLFLISQSVSGVEKLIAAAIYGGLLLLLVSVWRQRVIESKTDRYKDVDI